MLILAAAEEGAVEVPWNLIITAVTALFLAGNAAIVYLAKKAWDMHRESIAREKAMAEALTDAKNSNEALERTIRDAWGVQ